MIQFPYGLADYAVIARDGLYYIDRTDRIRTAEEMGDSYCCCARVASASRCGSRPWRTTTTSPGQNSLRPSSAS